MSKPITTLTIPISLVLGDGGLGSTFDHPRVLSATGRAELGLDSHERALFEAADFVVNGTTYRVHITASVGGRQIPWDRHGNGCRSPQIEAPTDLGLEIAAVPATTSARRSTTHTTIIIKKGKPFPLEP